MTINTSFLLAALRPIPRSPPDGNASGKLAMSPASSLPAPRPPRPVPHIGHRLEPDGCVQPLAASLDLSTWSATQLGRGRIFGAMASVRARSARPTPRRRMDAGTTMPVR